MHARFKRLRWDNKATLGLLLAVWMLAAAPTAAKAQDEQPELDTAAVRSGFQMYREGAWGQVQSVAENPTPDVRRPLLSIRLGMRQQIEFSRRLWLPPRSRQEVFTPIFPFEIPSQSNSIETPARLILDDRGATIQGPWQPALLPVRWERQATVHMGDSRDMVRRNLVRALRKAAGLNDVVLLAAERNIPSQPIAWRTAQVISIGQWQPKLRAHDRDALRRWLVSGGRLWVMLEQTDPEWLADVLGASWNVSVVDRVGLHEFTIEGPNESQHVESRHGIEMVRTLVDDDMEVIHRVNGYPASMRRKVGQGRLMVTTLSPDAWMTEDGEPRPALEDLRSFFATGDMTIEAEHQRVVEAFQPLVEEQIGHSTLGRGLVATVLGGFVLVLLATGGVLAWVGRLEMIGVASAVLSLVAAMGLYGLGRAHYSRQPLTIATGQLVHAVEDQPYISTIGASGIYVPPARSESGMTIYGSGGVRWPVQLDAMGTRTLLEWTDRGEWRYPDRALPPGAVHHFAGSSAQQIDDPVRATLRFTEAGMTGEVATGPFGQWADALIATRWGHITARLDDESGRIEPINVRSQRRLGRRQFIGGATLSDQQIRRQQVYRALADNGLFPEEPTLLAWVDGGPDDGLRLDAGEVRQNQSLMMTPIRIERPAPGTQLTVPAALIRKVRPHVSDVPRDYHPGTLYDERNQRWEAGRFESAAMLRFEVPRALREMDIQSARLQLHLRAPGWRYELLVLRDGEVVTIDEGSDPFDMIEIDLAGDDAPTMTDDGAAVVGVRVERSGADEGDQWEMEQMSLSITGVMPGDE